MKFFHYKNDLSFDVSLTSVTTGERMDASMIKLVKVWTRKNGRCYVACFGNETLINNGETVTVVLNNHGLEPGPLSYTVIIDIPDQVYPDRMKHIEQTYVSEIELVKGNGETEEADVQAFFGTTIDEKFQEINDAVDELNADTQVVKATIVQIQEHDAIQDSSIRNIEDIISGIHGDESASISRLNSSVNNLETDVNNLNTSVGNLNNLVDRLDADLAGISNDLENKADVSVLGNYALKTDLNDYPTNSSVSSTYATKAQVQACLDEDEVYGILEDYPTNSSVSDNYVHWLYANENYVSYENIDEIIVNVVDNNYDVHWKINEIVSDSSSFADISTNVKDISTLVSNVSTKLDRDYLTAHTINSDFVKNASLNTTLGSYVTKTQMNSSLLTKQDSLPFSDESDEIMDNDNLGIAGLAMNSVNGVDEYGILVTDGFEKDEQTGAYIGLENPITGNAAADLIQDYCEDFVQTTDISTFKPIVFCTQEEYDTLVENDQVDANTVYMLSGDQTGGDYLTPDDVSNFVTNSSLNDELSNYTTLAYLDEQLLQVDGNITNLLSNYVQNVSLNNDVSNLGYLKKNTDIEVSKVIFTGYENAINSYLDYTQQEDEIYLNLGLPDTDAGGELTDRQIVAARSEYDGDSERTELTFGGTATWTNLGNKWGNVNIKAKNVSIGSGSGNINILGQNVSIGGRNVNDFITSNDVSVYATTSYVDTMDSSIFSYVDTQIGNIQNILASI